MKTYTIEQIAEELYRMHDVYSYQRKTIEELRGETFENIGRTHDWRNYISITHDLFAPHKMQKQWQQLTDLQMILTYANAVKEAEREQWD